MAAPVTDTPQASAAEKLGGKEAFKKARKAWKKTAKQAKFTGEKPPAFLYFGVSMIALLKDLLDFVGLGSLPGIGFVVTFCLTFLIWILLTLFDTSSSSWKTRSNIRLARGLTVIFFGLIEAVGFGLNFLPIETVMVIVLYHLAKKAYKKAKKEADQNPAPAPDPYAYAE